MRKSWLFLTALALAACGGESAQPDPPATPDAIANVPALPAQSPRQSTVRWIANPAQTRPAYREVVRDPSFGTRVTRISDQGAFGTQQMFLRHTYSRNQPWNADGSLILLAFTYPAAIADAATLQFVRWLPQPWYAVWSHSNPRRLYGTYEGTNQLVAADLDAGDEVIHEFTEYSQIDFGAGEGNLSNDDRYIALFGFAQERTHLLVFDLVARQTVAEIDFGSARVCDCPDPGSINNATMSQSGNFVVVQFNTIGRGRFAGVEAYDRNLKFLRQLTPGSQHGDVGLTIEGHDVWVSYHQSEEFNPPIAASAYAWRLDNGAVTPVIPRGAAGGHISCRNVRLPGYCFASHSFMPSERALAGAGQIYAFPLDGSMQMRFFAHQHTTSAAYARQPQGVPNPDGSKVLWASDWDDVTAPVYAYVAEAD